MRHKPLLLGHRGCRRRPWFSRKLPTENSFAALEYALTAGCDGFEFDVRHTRDGCNVLWHDPKWQGLSLIDTNAAVLADKNGTRLATLEDVLRDFSGRAYFDIELKAAGNEKSVVAAIKNSPLKSDFLVSSFYPEILIRMHALDSALPLGYISDRAQSINLWRDLPIAVFLPQYRSVSQRLVDDVHSAGLQIMSWTVNRRDDMLRLAEWSIDGLISDDPQLLYQTFHSP